MDFIRGPRATSEVSSGPGGLPELNADAQCHLLHALITVKQAWPDCDQGVHDQINALSEQLFWTAPDGDPQSCLLEALGTFLTQILGVLAQISVSLVNGPHLDDNYVPAYIKSVSDYDDFADTSVVRFLDRKIGLLGQISTELNEAATRCEELWSSRPTHRPDWKLPTHPQGHPNIPPPTPTTDTLHTAAMPDTAAAPGSGHAAARLSAEERRALLTRGTGKHVCPHGFNCDKGGVEDDGRTLVVFVRNSTFRTHMAKHEKSYRCDWPGCPNTTGFARPDQLERHRRTVKHRAVS